MNISISAQISRYDMPAQQSNTNPNFDLMLRILEQQKQQERESNSSNRQNYQSNTYSCDDLIENLELNGKIISTLTPINLINSTWLYSVTQYRVENKIVVIAEIKGENNPHDRKKYIFCGVPESNWWLFYDNLNEMNLSYGEKFNKYIIDYTCNCN